MIKKLFYKITRNTAKYNILCKIDSKKAELVTIKKAIARAPMILAVGMARLRPPIEQDIANLIHEYRGQS